MHVIELIVQDSLIHMFEYFLEFTFFYNQNGETSDFSRVMQPGLLQTFSNYPFYTDVHPNVQKKVTTAITLLL